MTDGTEINGQQVVPMDETEKARLNTLVSARDLMENNIEAYGNITIKKRTMLDVNPRELVGDMAALMMQYVAAYNQIAGYIGLPQAETSTRPEEVLHIRPEDVDGELAAKMIDFIHQVKTGYEGQIPTIAPPVLLGEVENIVGEIDKVHKEEWEAYTDDPGLAEIWNMRKSYRRLNAYG